MSPQMFHMCNKELKVTVLSVILDKTDKRKFDYLYQGRIKGGGGQQAFCPHPLSKTICS